MNKFFQEFVTQALREALGVSDRLFRSDRNLPRQVRLDEAGRIRLNPDLSWWDGESCKFVGDAKYKNIDGRKNPPVSDLYQLLAYTTALDLPGGMLIYAKGEADPIIYKVQYSGKRLEVATLDLSCPLDEILAQVEGLARRVMELRNEARGLRSAA